MKRTYTDEQREAALTLVESDGLAEAWRQTGIPKTTLAMWAHDRGIRTDGAAKTAAATEAAANRAAMLREQLRTALLEKAVDLLERMDSEHVEFKGKDADMVTYPIAPAGAVQNYATSVGILIDKYRLEVGEATARSESRDLTNNDHESEVLRDVIAEELARRGERGQAADGVAETAVAHPAPAESGAA